MGAASDDRARRPDRDRPGEAVATRRGPAGLTVRRPAGAVRSLLVLGHGAGGSVRAPDLAAVTSECLGAAVAVALVTQPYRLAGRRAPAPAGHLDEAWIDAVAAVRARHGLTRVPLVVGGRSSGARVACRTAREAGAAGVVALAFPVHPPGRPERSRLGELSTGVPTLVVNGDRDPFGVPPPSVGVDVTVCPGERHDLARDPARVAVAVVDWLRRRGWAAGITG